MSTKDYYSILGVDSNSSKEEIKKAYRSLSMKYHPDRNQGNIEAEEKFKEINAAYEVLGDTDNRRNHDMMHKNPFFNFDHGATGNVNGVRIPVNPDDIINMMFGGLNDINMENFDQEFRFPGGSARLFTNMHHAGNPFNSHVLLKPEPISKSITITIEEAYTGCNIPITITRWIKNNNKQKTQEQETVYIEIPKGIDTNEIIMIKEKGNVIMQGDLKGDVKVIINIKNNSSFIRDGMDLVYHKTLSLKESLCGFSFELSHINGKTYNINNTKTNIVGNNQKKIINNLGMVRDKTSGSLIIEFNVEFPKTLSIETIDKLEKLL